jgi:hypothetical protein
MPIEHVIGDATNPRGTGPRIIVHVCNDVGGAAGLSLHSLANGRNRSAAIALGIAVTSQSPLPWVRFSLSKLISSFGLPT